MARNRTFDPFMRLHGTRERNAQRTSKSIERFADSVDALKLHMQVMSRLNSRSRGKWEVRFESPPLSGCPSGWRGKGVNSQMRSDYAHATKAQLKADSLREGNLLAREVSKR
jgi:hypothetical protein